MAMQENSGYNNKFEKEVMERLIKIETKLDNYEKVKDIAYQNQRDILELKNKSKSKDEVLKTKMEEMEAKITAMQDNRKWLERTIGATLIGIAIAVIIACIRLRIGD